MSADSGDLLVAEARFYEPANRFMAQVVKMEIGKAELANDTGPKLLEHIRLAPTIPTGLAKKDKIRVDRAYWIVQRCAQNFGRGTS